MKNRKQRKTDDNDCFELRFVMKSSDGSWSNPLCYVEHIRALFMQDVLLLVSTAAA